MAGQETHESIKDMGISLIPGKFLARNAKHVTDAKRGLVLGRQKLHLKGHRLVKLARQLKQYGIEVAPEDLVQEDGFTEKFLSAIGYPKLEAMDFTASEGAEHIHDLNKKVPKKLEGKFDLIIDGGTTEHIFHIGTALENCHAMLKPGGVMMSFVAADGWFGHGFFQTGPDVPWRYWHHCLGYQVLEAGAQERRGKQEYFDIPDPSGQRRGGVRAFNGPTMLLYAVRKPLEPKPKTFPVQGHYVDYER
ncbi:class I SAM-dependent methyltransferase [uncultured Roseobacter sp.]|uniref:class I SAM-dependent methyltransferase n=2 Tax=uncultured Roseobacter sp. TaxID=114847 RepID=UPI002635640F|nr:class I SAM-dependent methyltransferase [uncultured Roseobacter sp.]